MGKLGGVGGRGERTIIFGVFNRKEDGSWSKNPLSLSLSLSLSILKGGREGGQDNDKDTDIFWLKYITKHLGTGIPKK